MPLWDGPYMLGQFNRLAARPEADQISDSVKYTWLSEGQNEVIADIAARQPEALYPVAALPMISADGGKTWTYGTDSEGNPIFPMGKVRIYLQQTAAPGVPLSEGFDYMNEGNRIEIPYGRTSPQLFWRGITPPVKIDATTPPILNPPPARLLITLCAVKNFGQAGNINPELGAQMTEMWSREFPRWMLVYRTQYASGGALAPLTSGPFPGMYTYASYTPSTSASM
jgi:hypothetical protein